MFYLFILMIIMFVGGAAYALIRGLLAFAQLGENISDPVDKTANFQKQNSLMLSRVKWQALAVVCIVIAAGLAGKT